MDRDGRTAINATSESESCQPRRANEEKEGRGINGGGKSKQAGRRAHQDILDKGDGTDGALCVERKGCAISISWEEQRNELRDGMVGKRPTRDWNTRTSAHVHVDQPGVSGGGGAVPMSSRRMSNLLKSGCLAIFCVSLSRLSFSSLLSGAILLVLIVVGYR